MIYQQSINNVNKLLIDFLYNFSCFIFYFLLYLYQPLTIYKEYNMAVNQWCDSERVEFLIYVHHKYSTKKIAEILCRTESAIRAEASRLGISLRK